MASAFVSVLITQLVAPQIVLVASREQALSRIV